MVNSSRRLIARLAVGGVLAIAAVPVFASVFLKEDIGSLRRTSEAVVHARVLDMQSAWNDEGSMIFTQVTLQVVRSLRGSAPAEIVVRVPGGTVEGFTAVMHGAPEFEVGEQYVLFLSRWDDGVLMVNGYFQGQSRAVPDGIGNVMLRGGVAEGRSLAQLARELGSSR